MNVYEAWCAGGGKNTVVVATTPLHFRSHDGSGDFGKAVSGTKGGKCTALSRSHAALTPHGEAQRWRNKLMKQVAATEGLQVSRIPCHFAQPFWAYELPHKREILFGAGF